LPGGLGSLLYARAYIMSNAGSRVRLGRGWLKERTGGSQSVEIDRASGARCVPNQAESKRRTRRSNLMREGQQREAHDQVLLLGGMCSGVWTCRRGAGFPGEEGHCNSHGSSEPHGLPEDDSEPGTHTADGSEQALVSNEEPEPDRQPQDGREWQRQGPGWTGSAERQRRGRIALSDRSFYKGDPT